MLSMHTFCLTVTYILVGIALNFSTGSLPSSPTSVLNPNFHCLIQSYKLCYWLVGNKVCALRVRQMCTYLVSLQIFFPLSIQSFKLW